MKKVFFSIVFLIFTCISAYADNVYIVDPDSMIIIDYTDCKPHYVASLMSDDSIESAFHNAIKEHSIVLINPGDDVIHTAINIDLSAFNLDISTDEKYSEVEAMIYDLSYQSLEYFYLDSSLYPYVEGNMLTNLFFVVRSDFTGDGSLAQRQATLDNYITQYNYKCARILADVLYPGMTHAEIALALHSYLGENLYYDNDLEPLSFTSYNAIMGKKAVCQGYSFAYEHLLRLVGIEGVIATSKVMNHAWNVVNIDGNWYHIDATRDDIEGYGVTHRFFMLSDETLTERGHHSWESPVSCTSDDYETDYFFNPEYTDALYSSDFMTCRRNSDGYFIYMRNKKYYKSVFGGETQEISQEEYSRDRNFEIKLSAPFLFTEESFDFVLSNTNNAIIAVINQSDGNVTGKLITAYYAANKVTDAKVSGELTLNADEYLLCSLNSAPEGNCMKAFFLGDSLRPYSTSVCTE